MIKLIRAFIFGSIVDLYCGYTVIFGFDLLSAGTLKVSLACLYHVKSRLCACDGAAL